MRKSKSGGYKVLLNTWVALTLMLALTGCGSEKTSVSGSAAEDPAASQANARFQQGRLILAATKPGTRLDPHLDIQWEVLYVLSAVYDTLIYQDGEEFIAGLAKDWQLLDDGLRYRFTLREDVHFHDGSRFDAAAVAYNIERIRGFGPRSFKAASLLRSVSRVEVQSPFVVDIVLSQPDGSFLFNLSLPYLSMVSPAAAQQWGDQYHLHQSGTGPYQFSEYVPGDHYTLTRNPNYQWAPQFKQQAVKEVGDMPRATDQPVAEMVWRFLPEPSTRAPALEAGDVDVAFDLVPTNLQRIKNAPDLSVTYAYLTGQPAYWFINTQKAPTDELAVRQAILYAADMTAGTQAITRGICPPAHGPLSAVTAEYSPALDDLYAHDPAKAKQLLDEAGWRDQDGDGIRERDGKPLAIDLSMVSWGQSRHFSVLLQAQLRDVGIQVNLEMMDYAVQLEAGQAGRKNLLFTGSTGYSAADSLRPYFHSDNVDSGFAFSKYEDPELDRLLDRAAVTMETDQRTALYQQAQTRIMDAALILPIYDFALLIGTRQEVEGLSWRSVGLVPTYDQMTLRTAGD